MAVRSNPAAVITGAGAGIGRATAQALAARGYDLVLADLDPKALEAVAAEVRAGRPDARVLLVPGDISDPRTVEAVFDRAGRDVLHVRAVVHCAGLFPRRSFAEGTLDDFDRVMAVNLRAAFLLAKAGVPAMQPDGGAMVFMTSGSGLPGAVADPMQADFSLYGASKAALDRWALGIAGEVARAGVTVNVLCPGAVVLTPGVQALGLDTLAARNAIAVERVADAVAWLASNPEDGPVGRRFVATEFGRAWGP